VSTLCSKYYSFLENTIDVDNTLNTLKNNCDNIMSWCLQYDFINCDIQELLDQFPKYLNYSNFIDTKSLSSGYNHDLIYNSTTMTQSQLSNEISKDPSLYSIEKKIKYFPEYLDDQIKEYIFQNNYSISISDLIFNKDFYFYNYKSNNYSDRFSNLLNSFSDDHLSRFFKNNLGKQSFFHLYFINSLINSIFNERTDLREVIFFNSSSFTQPVLTENINKHFENIVDIVLMNQFSFTNITDSFKETIYQSVEIQESVSEIDGLFNAYIGDNVTLFKTDVLETVFDIIGQNVSFNLLKNNFDSNASFNFIKINELFSYNTFTSQEARELMQLYLMDINFTGNNLSNFENDLYIFYIKSLNNNYSIRNYYYLLYYYRPVLQRFISAIDLIATEYVDTHIDFSALNYFNSFEHMSNLFTQWSTCIRYNKFAHDLDEEITSVKIQQIVDNNPNILKMALTYAYHKQIESFVQTNTFKNQVFEIHNDIYSCLRSNGILDKDVDWCNCSKPLEIYLSFALKNLVETVNTSTLNDYIENQISNFNNKIFENENEFDLFVKDFNIKNSYYFYEFYKAFVFSDVTSSFSRALHAKFSL